jgi:hypothetical protein
MISTGDTLVSPKKTIIFWGRELPQTPFFCPVSVTCGQTSGIEKRGGLLRRRFLSFLNIIITLEGIAPHEKMSILQGKNPLNNPSFLL